jgi:hypothetical protein
MQHLSPHGPDDRLIDLKTLVREWFDDELSGRTVDRQVAKGEFPPFIRIGIKKFWWESILRNHFAQQQEQAYRQQAKQISEAQ